MADPISITTRELAYAPPEAVAARLARAPWFVWLDSETSASPFARYSFQAAAPIGRLSITRRGATLNDAPVDAPVAELMRALTTPLAARPAGELPPLLGGSIGYLAYEFAEHVMAWRSPHLGDGDAVLAELGYYPAVLAWDHRDKTCSLIAIEEEGEAAAELLAAAHAEARAEVSSGELPPAPGWSMADLVWRPGLERAAFVEAIGRVKDYIGAGDIYQANLAQAFGTRLPAGASALEHYRLLRRANPAPFAAFLDFPGRTVGSTSPERFLAVDGERVEARPIKGTIRTGASAAEDREAIRRLTSSEKERAENVMIVDLLRNDLSRVCRPHTVKTPEVCVVETYEGLHHLVSAVTGALKPGAGALDAVLAAFPGGSITGAPKLRAMEIIGELEPEARGMFCGVIGYLGVDGTADFNIAIRTVEYAGRDARLLAGGGVTYLSDPAAEYEESLLKAEKMLGGRRA